MSGNIEGKTQGKIPIKWRTTKCENCGENIRWWVPAGQKRAVLRQCKACGRYFMGEPERTGQQDMWGYSEADLREMRD